MARRKLRSAFQPRRARNVEHVPTVPLALSVAFASSCRRQAYQALANRRKAQHTTTFQQVYALRAGIEGTISQGVRRTRMRRSPYRGERKHMCIMCRLRRESMCFASSRIFMHRRDGKPSRSSTSSIPLCVSPGGGSTVTLRGLNNISQQSHLFRGGLRRAHYPCLMGGRHYEAGRMAPSLQ